MTKLKLAADDVRDLKLGDRRVLFHVPTSGLFSLDAVGGEIMDLVSECGTIAEDDVRRRFDGRYPPREVVDTLQELVSLRVLGDGGPRAQVPIRIERFPLSAVVLSVGSGCNLSCTYCYKEDLATPGAGRRMSPTAAQKAIDLLFAEAAERERVSVVFFGGEPLAQLPLIHHAVAYAEDKARATGKIVDFSLTTNATLLDDETVAWLDAHNFGITVSIDGPQDVHDRHRRTAGGKGSYQIVADKARRLIDRYRSRPVGARVTLTAGAVDVVGIHQHLVEDIGFFEAGFSPVTAPEAGVFALSGPELRAVFDGMTTLGRRYRDAAIAGRNIGFGNMHQLMIDLADGTSKTLPCGAGIGMVAVDTEGAVHLCHRFAGSKLPTFGSVETGLDKPGLSEFLHAAADRTGTACDTCWIRRLCAGGCYHEAYSRYQDPLHPNDHYCALLRDWVEFGIGVYADIQERSPAFIERHIAPRRGKQ